MLSRFQWHQEAKAFAGRTEVARQGHGSARIPATPCSRALEDLRTALGGSSAFCVSDTPLPPIDTLDPDHFATLTGGTSGPPKVIVRSQLSWIKSFHANAAQFAYTPNDSIAVLGTLTHSLALYGVLEGLHLGLTVHALAASPPSGQRNTVHSAGITILYATPTQLRLLPPGTTLPNIRLILCGGGALPPATRTHITALCPNASLYVFYGAAETSFITLSDADTPEGSVGRPYPEVEIEIRDPDPTGTGALWVRSPYLFNEYLQGGSTHTRHDDGWLTIGEIGRLDTQGCLFLRGRAGRVFTIADQTIYPEELEAQFMSLHGVPNCAVLARVDPLRGHHLIVVVEGPESANLRKTLFEQCTRTGVSRPRDVIFLDPFPLLPSGKPDLMHIATLTGATL